MGELAADRDRAARHAIGQSDGWVLPNERPLQRSLPFLLAIAFALALLPLQRDTHEGPLLWSSIGLLVLLFAVWSAQLQGWVRVPAAAVLLPIAYLCVIALLRSATGGLQSGYASLLYLAPFWVALYGSRLQVVLVTVGMFVALAAPIAIGDEPAPSDLRGALLTTAIIGMISLAVNRSVIALRRAKSRVRREADARAHAYEELRGTADALARSNGDLEQFAYVTSHDLQEPLRMIRSFSQLFMQRHGDQVDEEGRELLGFVTNGAERAQRLVTDLLEYSRVGTQPPTLDALSLDRVLDRALETLMPSIEATRAEIIREGDMPVVCGEQGLLERLLVNLVGNALRYRHVDRDPRVTISAEAEGDMWAITVADNGIGFDDEHAQRIFKLFQRLHARDAYDGTGIGLAICERIVELHGGRITASATPGVGSRFTFTIGAPS